MVRVTENKTASEISGNAFFQYTGKNMLLWNKVNAYVPLCYTENFFLIIKNAYCFFVTLFPATEYCKTK